jgi:hypothetical protein
MFHLNGASVSTSSEPRRHRIGTDAASTWPPRLSALWTRRIILKTAGSLMRGTASIQTSPAAYFIRCLHFVITLICRTVLQLSLIRIRS